MNAPAVPPKPPFNDALYQALSPLNEHMKMKQDLQKVRMKFNPIPVKKPTSNEGEIGPQGERYQ